MKPLVLFLALLAGLAPVNAYALDPAEWEPLYGHHQLELGADETYSIFVIQPQNVQRMLDDEKTVWAKESLRQQLWHNRAQTNTLLENAELFIRSVYFDREVFDSRTKQGLVDGLKDLKSGKHPVILITKYNDPFVIYQIISVGLDFGKGIPTEQRCVGRGMEKLPRPTVRLEKVPVRHLPTFGSLNFDAETERVLSEMPRVVGSIAEIKTFSKSRYSKYDFGPLVHRLMLAHRLHFWGGDAIPESLRPPPPTAEQQRVLETVKAKHPELPDEVLFPHRQERIINDRFYIRAGRRALVRLYESEFGFEKPVQTFPDPDFDGVTSFIQGLDRARLEQGTAELMTKRSDFRLVAEGRVAQNDFEALSCSRLLHLDDFNKKSARPGARIQGIRLTDTRTYVVPHGSILNRRIGPKPD